MLQTVYGDNKYYGKWIWRLTFSSVLRDEPLLFGLCFSFRLWWAEVGGSDDFNVFYLDRLRLDYLGWLLHSSSLCPDQKGPVGFGSYFCDTHPPLIYRLQIGFFSSCQVGCDKIVAHPENKNRTLWYPSQNYTPGPIGSLHFLYKKDCTWWQVYTSKTETFICSQGMWKVEITT